MIVYVLFVHKKSVSKRKVCIIFIKSEKFKTKNKKPILMGFLGVFFVFFGWVFIAYAEMSVSLASVFFIAILSTAMNRVSLC
jgi:hypothetical protein